MISCCRDIFQPLRYLFEFGAQQNAQRLAQTRRTSFKSHCKELRAAFRANDAVALICGANDTQNFNKKRVSDLDCGAMS